MHQYGPDFGNYVGRFKFAWVNKWPPTFYFKYLFGIIVKDINMAI